MSTATLSPPSVVHRRPRVVGITVDQYEFLIRSGRLAETPTKELVDGQIVYKDRSRRGDDPTSIGEEHAWVVTRLGKLDRQLDGSGSMTVVSSPSRSRPGTCPNPTV